MKRTGRSPLAKSAAATFSALVFVALLVQAQGGCDTREATPSEPVAKPRAAEPERSAGEAADPPRSNPSLDPETAAARRPQVPALPEAHSPEATTDTARIERAARAAEQAAGAAKRAGNAAPWVPAAGPLGTGREPAADEAPVFLGSSKSDPDIWGRGGLEEGFGLVGPGDEDANVQADAEPKS